jgi:hypothetical protein
MTTERVGHYGFHCKTCRKPIHDGDQAWFVGKHGDFRAGLTCMHCTKNGWIMAEESDEDTTQEYDSIPEDGVSDGKAFGFGEDIYSQGE